MARPRYKRTTAPGTRHQEEAVPVVLPHVVMTITGDGAMSVTVDGAPWEPEPFAPAWRREDFARLLDQLTERHRSPVRVEVREADGTVFTDIITPGKPHRTEPGPEPEAAVSVPRVVPELVALRGEGFVPGEDVAIAVIVAHGDAAPDGTMRGLITADQLAASPTREVILFGRISGTLTIGRPE
ncbi:hypothetical protein [Agromyces aerolatus]|uniref:hypothetical protein n=1 Tax=Agromyces sp. LY-1074 TaxID=3074080 RepID=UPI002866CB0C|nr:MULTISPECIES: hypothetical protein [unclassified Agromyces]MDR5701783.1 hypothetical protein [Agromyces sp. LY-1074]MDR5708030.1 hypothetical protein [Agromyces sp. LY-1358]